MFTGGGWNSDKNFVDKSKILDSMFNKYDSDYPKNEAIFRGIRFKKGDSVQNARFKVLIDILKEKFNNNNFIDIDKAPASFSKEEKTAKKFGSFSDKRYYTVLFVLSNRKSSELDIEKISENKNQREIIVQTHKAKYKIDDIIINELGDKVVVKIEEVKL